MTRYNFREVERRFRHIDGVLVSGDASFRQREEVATTRLVFAFYPWWEHPEYLAATIRNGPWGFEYSEEAYCHVVVDAVEPLLCQLRPPGDAIEIAFSSDHPELWQFENQGEVFCNSGFEPRALIVALLKRKIPHVTQAVLLRYLAPYLVHEAPCSLGYFPRSLYLCVKEELLRMGVALFSAPDPEPTRAPVALFVDDELVVIANDFFVEVPDFEHRPEWFKPVGLTSPGD